MIILARTLAGAKLLLLITGVAPGLPLIQSPFGQIYQTTSRQPNLDPDHHQEGILNNFHIIFTTKSVLRECGDGDVAALLAIRSVWPSELVTTLMGTLHQTQTTHILYLYPPLQHSSSFLSPKIQIIFAHRKFQQKYEAFVRLHESKADLTELTILFKLSD